MGQLEICLAMGNYDRNRPIYDGRVQIDGVDPTCFLLSPEEMFFRAFRHEDFDVTEVSFSSYLLKLSRNECPYVAIPVFLSRAFRHTSIYVRKDRIHKPADLIGKRIGVPEYQLTAIVWARALLQDDFGVDPSSIHWVRGGIDEPGRVEKVGIELPSNINIENAPPHKTISDMLNDGELDAFIAPRAPSGAAANNPNVGWLFEDPTEAAKDYYRRTNIFPIMHLVGVRKTLADRHPWLPATLLKAFSQSKQLALDELSDTSATKITLPFVEEQLKAARDTLGQDFWSYGVDGNINTLNSFLSHHYKQGLSKRKISLNEIFHPSTYDTFKI